VAVVAVAPPVDLAGGLPWQRPRPSVLPDILASRRRSGGLTRRPIAARRGWPAGRRRRHRRLGGPGRGPHLATLDGLFPRDGLLPCRGRLPDDSPWGNGRRRFPHILIARRR